VSKTKKKPKTNLFFSFAEIYNLSVQNKIEFQSEYNYSEDTPFIQSKLCCHVS